MQYEDEKKYLEGRSPERLRHWQMLYTKGVFCVTIVIVCVFTNDRSEERPSLFKASPPLYPSGDAFCR